MSNFSFLKTVNKEVYKIISDAEKYAYKDFKSCGNKCRQAVEGFIKIVADEQRFELGEDLRDDLNILMHTPPFNSIRKYVSYEFRTDIGTVEKKSAAFYYFLRKFGNACSHTAIQPEDPLLNFDNVVTCMLCCHILFAEYYKKEAVKIPSFSIKAIPIGDFNVIRSFVPSDSERSKCIREFFCCTFRYDSSEVGEYAVIRQYEKDSVSDQFLLRNYDTYLAAARGTKDGTGRKSVETLVSLDDNNSDFYIIAYKFSEGEPMQLTDKILLDVNTEQRLKMCKTIAACINTLHNSKIPVYHRMITYDSVVVCNNGDEWIPYVIKFDFSKITAPDRKTVRTDLNKARADIDKRERSLQKYLAPEWNSISDSDPVDGETWKKIDVYSLGILLCDILAGRFDAGYVKKSELAALGLSKELIDIIYNMTSEIVSERGQLCDVIAAIDKELEKWN